MYIICICGYNNNYRQTNVYYIYDLTCILNFITAGAQNTIERYIYSIIQKKLYDTCS